MAELSRRSFLKVSAALVATVYIDANGQVHESDAVITQGEFNPIVRVAQGFDARLGVRLIRVDVVMPDNTALHWAQTGDIDEVPRMGRAILRDMVEEKGFYLGVLRPFDTSIAVPEASEVQYFDQTFFTQ